MNYTKGEWRYSQDYRYHNVINEKGRLIVRCGTMEESKANAQLIASAPDLYEALRIASALICNQCNDLSDAPPNCDYCNGHRQRMKALAKAEK